MTFLTMLLALFSLSFATAQNSPEAKKQVAAIREFYSQAKQNIAENDKSTDSRNDMEIVSHQSINAGQSEDTFHYYFTAEDKEEIQGKAYNPYFITHKYVMPAWDYYEEFLYNENGELVFYFRNSYEDGFETEVRFYSDKGKVIHETKKGEDEYVEIIDWESTKELSDKYKAVFNTLMN